VHQIDRLAVEGRETWSQTLADDLRRVTARIVDRYLLSHSTSLVSRHTEPPRHRDELISSVTSVSRCVASHRHSSIETLARSAPLIIFHAPCVSPPATTMWMSDGS